MERSFFHPTPDQEPVAPIFESSTFSERFDELNHLETDGFVDIQNLLAILLRNGHETIPPNITNSILLPLAETYTRDICERECLLAIRNNRSVWFSDYATALNGCLEQMWSNNRRPQLVAKQFRSQVPTLRERWLNRTSRRQPDSSSSIEIPSTLDLTLSISDWYRAQYPNGHLTELDYSLSVKCVRDVFVQTTEDIFRTVAEKPKSN